MMLLSIGCAVCGAYWQTRYEQDLHLSDPDRFPPNPIFHALDKLKEHREKKRARQACCAHPRPRGPAAHYPLPD